MREINNKRLPPTWVTISIVVGFRVGSDWVSIFEVGLILCTVDSLFFGRLSYLGEKDHT